MTPHTIEQLAGRRVKAIAAGGGGLEGGHTTFIVDDGETESLWVCGHGRWGQLGIKSFKHISDLKQVSTLSRFKEWDETLGRTMPVKIVKVACGDRHTAVLLGTGNVFVWGWCAVLCCSPD